MIPVDRQRRRTFVALLPVLLVLAGVLLSGCVRIRAAMAVSEDDRVSGEVIVAALPADAADRGPQLQLPTELASRARVEPYDADGYLGSRLTFNGLGFEELRVLATAATKSNNRYKFSLRRSGGLVTLFGSIDLTQMPVERADVQVKISFPGSIAATNGRNDKGTVSWAPRAGQVTELSATAQYSDATVSSWMRWAVILAVGAGTVTILVVLLALFAHRRHARMAAAEQA